jgi:hypothetical protein
MQTNEGKRDNSPSYVGVPLSTTTTNTDNDSNVSKIEGRAPANLDAGQQ